MKRALLALILALPLALSAQFRIVGTGLFTTINDSTYRAKIDFRPDLTGNSYNPTQLNDSMLVLSQKGQLYRLDSFYNASFSSAFIIVVEKNGNWGSPVGQIMVFQNNSSLAAPQAVYGANGATAGMQAGVDTWNSLLLKVVSDSAVYWNQAYSNSIDSAAFSGTVTKTLELYRASGDTLKASFVITGGADSLYVAEDADTTLLTNGDTLNLTAYQKRMPFDSVTFNVNETDASLRELKYSEEKGYLQYGGQDSVQIPILPGIWYVRNDTSVTIPKGTVLRATGTLGASGRIKVKHMIANGSIDAMYILGIAMHDIAVGADGYAMSQGKIRQVNTTAYSEGAVLYADVDTLGGLTQTEPGNGFLKLPIAFVVHSASNGTIAVRITSGAYMRDLHDTEITSPVSNASIYYNSSEGIWRDTTAAALKSDISGTTNYLAKFTGSNAVGNSGVFESGGNVGIGTASPTAKLHINNPNSTTSALNIVSNSNVIGSTNDAVRIDMTAAQVNQTNYGIRIVNGGFPSNEGDAIGLQSVVNARNTSYGLVGSASKNWGGNSLFGGAIGVYGSGTTDSPFGFSYGGYFKNDTTQGTGFGAFIQTTTPKGSGTVTPLAIQHNSTELMRVQSSGNVGIGTSTPSEALDVNGVGRFRQSGGSGGGPIEISDRKSTFNQNINWNVYYDGSNWKYRNSDFGASIGFNNSGDLIFANIASGTAGSNVTAFRERLKINENGNVGIATSSPSRPLHVNSNISMIIPSGATGTRPSAAANGDIRYNTDKANFEWYTSAGWREPVNAARKPADFTANRFAKFDADGLLDTSAVLTQSNGRIGIGVTPTEALQVNGTARATRLAVNTLGVRTNSISNTAAAGTDGFNLFIANETTGNNLTGTGVSGSYNVAVGTSAMNSITTGFNNVAMGVTAMLSNNTGYGNVALGRDALRLNTSGFENMAIGKDALYSNISGDGNVAIGSFTLYFNTGSTNLAFGRNALRDNTSASNNVAIGSAALFENSGASNKDNTAIGTGAFSKGQHTNSVAIGFNAGRLSSNGSDMVSTVGAILIGYDARTSATTSSPNEIVIGYLGRGNGSNTTTIGNSSTTATILPAGSLSVSTTSTTNKLNINGNAVIGSSYIGTAAPADGLLVVGNVGIGASTVDYKLHCAGVGYFGTGLRVDYTAAFSDSTIFQLPNTATKKARAFAWSTYSDARIKSNFDTIQNALQAVQALKPVYYDQHDSEVIDGKIKLQDGKTRTVGFIAQDVAPVIPAAVQAGNDTQLWGMDYTKLIPYLTKAIQEQQAQIEALKKEIEALKNK